MNQTIKQKWLSALRSGEYKQGRHVLFDGKRFCCLGVLCDIYLKENNVKEGDEYYWKFEAFSKAHRFNNVYRIPLAKDILPPYVANFWAGIYGMNAQNPIILDKTLSQYNDEGKSFTEIADLIEKHL